MSRNLTLDLLKIFLALLVVGIHGAFLKNEAPTTSYILINYAFRIAVPAFFVISGFFLYKKINHFREVISWEKKVLFLYLFWSAVYLPFLIKEGFDTPTPILSIIITIIMGYHHLWYLPAMMVAAFMLYFLRKLPDIVLTVLGVLLYIIGVSIQYAGKYTLLGPEISRIIDHYEFYRNAIFFGFPLIVSGYLLAKNNAVKKVNSYVFAISIAIGTLFAVIECYINMHLNNMQRLDMLLFVPFISISLVALALKWFRPNNSNYILYMSSIIYFIHPLIIEHFFIYDIQNTLLRFISAIAVIILISPLVIFVNELIQKRFKFSIL